MPLPQGSGRFLGPRWRPDGTWRGGKSRRGRKRRRTIAIWAIQKEASGWQLVTAATGCQQSHVMVEVRMESKRDPQCELACGLVCVLGGTLAHTIGGKDFVKEEIDSIVRKRDNSFQIGRLSGVSHDG